jgi:hypothetical protein
MLQPHQRAAGASPASLPVMLYQLTEPLLEALGVVVGLKVARSFLELSSWVRGSSAIPGHSTKRGAAEATPLVSCGVLSANASESRHARRAQSGCAYMTTREPSPYPSMQEGLKMGGGHAIPDLRRPRAGPTARLLDHHESRSLPTGVGFLR